MYLKCGALHESCHKKVTIRSGGGISYVPLPLQQFLISCYKRRLRSFSER